MKIQTDMGLWKFNLQLNLQFIGASFVDEILLNFITLRAN